MRALNVSYRRDDGWTFIEATLAIVIMAIMVLGLTIVLLAFREQLDRSWAVRVMDQYGNDVIENLTYDLRNAVGITVRGGIGNTSRIDVEYLDPVRHDQFLIAKWRADLRNLRVTRENEPVDPLFPPTNLGRGEYYEIVQFTCVPYGSDSPNDWERDDSFRRKASFMNAAWDIRFKLRYTRQAIEAGERNWSVEKEYFNRVYMRNVNLIVKQGITD
jgi:type II secretory pathway pseudopilin PulG